MLATAGTRGVRHTPRGGGPVKSNLGDDACIAPASISPTWSCISGWKRLTHRLAYTLHISGCGNRRRRRRRWGDPPDAIGGCAVAVRRSFPDLVYPSSVVALLINVFQSNVTYMINLSACGTPLRQLQLGAAAAFWLWPRRGAS